VFSHPCPLSLYVSRVSVCRRPFTRSGSPTTSCPPPSRHQQRQQPAAHPTPALLRHRAAPATPCVSRCTEVGWGGGYGCWFGRKPVTPTSPPASHAPPSRIALACAARRTQPVVGNSLAAAVLGSLTEEEAAEALADTADDHDHGEVTPWRQTERDRERVRRGVRSPSPPRRHVHPAQPPHHP